jgi:ribose transport system permease protein
MKNIGGHLLLNYRYLLLAVLIIMASVTIGDPGQNFINVVTLQVPYVLIYTFGMTIAMLTGGLDLSQGSVAALSTCIGAMLVIQDQIILGIIVTLAIGAGVGTLNGFLVTRMKVPAFITTYGMNWVVRGLVYIIMGGTIIHNLPAGFRNISLGTIFGISNLFYIAVIVFLIMFFIFNKTTYGRNVYMIGSNQRAAKLTGVNTGKTVTLVYMISGILAALAGMLYVARLDAAESYLGKGFTLTALASTLIGGTALEGGKGGVGNTVVGVLIMTFLINMLNVWRVNVLWQDAVFGVVIVISALLEKARSVYALKLLK